MRTLGCSLLVLVATEWADHEDPLDYPLFLNHSGWFGRTFDIVDLFLDLLHDLLPPLTAPAATPQQYEYDSNNKDGIDYIGKLKQEFRPIWVPAKWAFMSYVHGVPCSSERVSFQDVLSPVRYLSCSVFRDP